ncbi:molybdopterin synthase catalytic subunit 2 isoform X1 [Dunckerocampus dactyliophorus]|uniref:molybdopterin synthase catalytic subunit 2 isoform X1 n=1 Tax=Dunckerocampus dactyliophorus TaxID=161453 RepID=UPI002404F408|nr:molybdopterin synthase catalytic subunit 2 isoform X1 [Dunckerocampus dactyliophorus]XP_054614101.1 molybdopterin synthase catalytic subunit 2 isoform X1 [Dunckerocampus dactyliophorus]
MAMSEEVRNIFKLSRDWLSVQEVVAAVSSASCGAISLFIGTTRADELDGRKVIGLEYEAYEAMVQSELSRLCDDIRARWPGVTHICVHHRLGSHHMLMLLLGPSGHLFTPPLCSAFRWVKVGEASVVMAISSPHRHDGQQAIQHLIEQLKACVPVWKKEVYDSHEAAWKENAECGWSSRHEDATQKL